MPRITALALSLLFVAGCAAPEEGGPAEAPATALEDLRADDGGPTFQEAPIGVDACTQPMWREGAAGLAIATKAFLQGGDVVVGILGVNDSRCPQDKVCIREGEASVRLAIQTDGDVSQHEVRERESVVVDGYEITVMDISRADPPEVILGLFELEAAACPVTI